MAERGFSGLERVGERAGARRVARLVRRLEARAEAILPVDLAVRADAHGLVIEGRGARVRGRGFLEDVG